MMGNLANSAVEDLNYTLSFKRPSSGQSAVDRHGCTFHAEGSNSYFASAGTKVIRFRLAGDGQWLDPATFRIMFDAVSNDANPTVKKLHPIGRAHAFCKRFRIRIRGQIIEDIDNYNRVCELLHILPMPAPRTNDAIEQVGYNYDISQITATSAFPGLADSQTVTFQPLCGILQQTKYLPLR